MNMIWLRVKNCALKVIGRILELTQICNKISALNTIINLELVTDFFCL